MPGTDAARSFAELRRHEAAAPKMLYAIDAHCTADSPVTDVAVLTALARAAVVSGGGHVLDTSHVVFPNGAITLVLILAESHLSIHTWPEENLIAIDLFSCGAIDGQAVLDELTGSLRLTQVTVRHVQRGLPATSARGEAAPD
jgi:S-adenosylmethionine decarboxylase